jgi:transcriptional regulator with XRE-family HTH domain
MNAAPISQRAFASRVGVSKQRVSQWLHDKKIDGDAIVSQGGRVLILAEPAKAQLRQRLDASQMTGNGLDTRLRPEAEQLAPPPTAEPTIEDEIKREKLTILRAERRKVLEEESARAGRYCVVDDVKRSFGQIYQRQMTMVVALFDEVAAATAVRFQLPSRDVVHFARTKLYEFRVRVARQLRAEADAMPEFVEDDALAELDAAAGEIDGGGNQTDD